MAYYTKDGQEIKEVLGRYVDPETGKLLSELEMAQKANSGEYFPDSDSLSDARDAGYTGKSIENYTAAQNALSELEGSPDITNMVDENGNLKSAYTLAAPESILGQIDEKMADAYSTLGTLKDYATDTDTSAYAQALLDQEAIQAGQQRSSLANQQNTAYSSALRNLGTSGGYDSGARERAARESSKNYATGMQTLGSESASNRLGIKAQDEASKLSTLQSLPSLYTSTYTPYLNQLSNEYETTYDTSKYNIDNTINQTRAAEQLKLDKYKLQKQLEASNKESYQSGYDWKNDIY